MNKISLRMTALVLANWLWLFQMPAWANNPPGPQMIVAEILILPLMMLITAIARGYTLIQRRPLKWLLVIAGLFVSLMHQGFAFLVMLAFTGAALGRSVQLIIWGLQAGRPEPKIELRELQPQRLLISGFVLALIALFLLSIHYVFIAFFPYDFYSEQELKSIIQAQLDYAQAQKTQTGQPRYIKMIWDEDSHILRFDLKSDLPAPHYLLEDGAFKFRSASVTFKATVKQPADLSRFELWLAPDNMPPFPYNYLTSMPSYYANHTGVIRMERTRWSHALCSENAPILWQLKAQPLAK